MVETIGPMVSRPSDRVFGVGVAHLIGGLTGGVLTGVVALTIGHLISSMSPTRDVNPALLALAALGAMAVELVSPHRRLGPGRQTPQSWRYLMPPRWSAFLYGADLGLGWSTRIHTTLIPLLAAVTLFGTPSNAVLLFALFGGSRAATVVVLSVFQSGTNSIDVVLSHANVPRMLALAASLVLILVTLGL
jgi:cytochrome c biogenesis protein CcdA